MKFVEVGTTVKRLLRRSTPFKKSSCYRTDCVPCQTDSAIDCRTTYIVKCEECGTKKMYKGQTGRTIYDRFKEHNDDFQKKRDRCPLWRHATLFHDGQQFKYKIRIDAECFGRSSRRLITESVLIDELTAEQTMNSKSEWSYYKLQKVQVGR